MIKMTEPATARGGSVLPERTDTRAAMRPALHKWRDLLDPIKACAAELKLNGTDIHFLDVLLSFVPGVTLDLDRNGQCIVFASNATIAERMGRSGDSTVNRCIRRAEDRGLIARRMAPNRKRFRRCGAGGAVLRAYGIDLAPLLDMYPQLLDLRAAADAAARDARLKRDDCAIVLAKLRGLLHAGRTHHAPMFERLSQFERRIRRKLSLTDLVHLEHDILDTLAMIETDVAANDPSNTNGQIEQHKEHHSKEILNNRNTQTNSAEATFVDAFPTLTKVLQNSEKNGSLDQSLNTAAALLPDSTRAWRYARQHMGAPAASILLGAVLERHASLDNPGGYLRHLVKCWQTGELDLHDLMRRSMTPVCAI